MKRESLAMLDAVDVDLEEIGVIEAARRRIPERIQALTQVIVDNPAQVALVGAGAIVVTRAASNLVKPRTFMQSLALVLVLDFTMSQLMTQAVKKGWLQFKVRDEDGCLVPLDPADWNNSALLTQQKHSQPDAA